MRRILTGLGVFVFAVPFATAQTRPRARRSATGHWTSEMNLKRCCIRPRRPLRRTGRWPEDSVILCRDSMPRPRLPAALFVAALSLLRSKSSPDIVSGRSHLRCSLKQIVEHDVFCPLRTG